MRLQSQDDIIESLEDIIETMRAILVQEGDDPAILHEARVALSDWLTSQYGPPRTRLHLIKGSVRRSGSARQRPLLHSVEEL